MHKRILGRTNFEVSTIGFGGIPIQNVEKEHAIKLIIEAQKQGINFIDTARGYTKSEELIGYGIEATGRENWIIATKSPARDYESMKKEVEISLRNLRVKTIDLYQFHNVRTEEHLNDIMNGNGALKALKEAKEKGLIREIGITSHDVHILERVIETGEFSTIQFPYNPVERQGAEVFKRAKELNIGVIVMKPLAGGAITNAELSLRYILENTDITSVIPGMDKIEQIIENSKVGTEYRPLNQEERDIINAEADKLGTEFCRRCGYCAPCPQEIDIPSQFIIEGYYTRYGLKDWAIQRYSGVGKKASECIECGVCETRCPYDLPIREMLKRVSANLE